MTFELLKLIIARRSSGDTFSGIRKELISSKKFSENDINKAIGIIHDHEAKISEYEILKRKNLSLTIGSFIIFISSSVYTFFTYLNPELSYFVLLYGPILAGFVFGFISLGKYRSAKEHLELLRNKFNVYSAS